MRADEAYTGQAFRIAKDALRRAHARWFILSAWYGLIRPSTCIEHYDLKMTPIQPGDSWDEGFRHVTDKDLALLRGAPLICLGSELYAHALEWMLDRPVERPVAGLPIGRMLQALKAGHWISHHDPQLQLLPPHEIAHT
jgi:hypothetical protein